MKPIALSRIVAFLVLPVAAVVGCSGDDAVATGTTSTMSSSTGGPVCPDGIAPADPTEFQVFECPDADPTNDACCTESPVYCAVVACPEPDKACNIYEKTLYACEGERWGGKLVLDSCPAKTVEELEALDGKPCSNEAPCDITRGDGDPRIAVCKDGAWKVFSMYPKRG